MNDGFEKFKAEEKPNHKDDIIQELETRVIELEDKILEERFYWLLLVVIIFNMVMFSHMESWGGPVSITFLELIGLLILAHKCGVDIVVQIIDRIIDGLLKINHKQL